MGLQITGLNDHFVHRINKSDAKASGINDEDSPTIRLVEDSTNEISIPITLVDGINSRQMTWNNTTHQFDTSGNVTRISDFIKQINDRYSETAMSNNIVKFCKTIDADALDTLVFTPGATAVGSTQDFPVIISDQEGKYESRGFQITLAHNSTGIDSGEILLRRNNTDLPW